ALQRLRQRVRDGHQVATTVGFGPRFLHSTGQLHKGGANNGVFLQITCDDAEALPVPGQGFGFSLLKQAQEAGDFMALSSRGRRLLRVHLKDVEAGLAALAQAIGA
ncbi:MAG: transaldolase, partial [Deltaproteobacteria bacterium]|nr:transaldolase [Deltaproteobacteria bacterium]